MKTNQDLLTTRKGIIISGKMSSYSKDFKNIKSGDRESIDKISKDFEQKVENPV